jgi:hypothetical protein
MANLTLWSRSAHTSFTFGHGRRRRTHGATPLAFAFARRPATERVGRCAAANLVVGAMQRAFPPLLPSSLRAHLPACTWHSLCTDFCRKGALRKTSGFTRLIIDLRCIVIAHTQVVNPRVAR